jgi:hypothetical protein
MMMKQIRGLNLQKKKKKSRLREVVISHINFKFNVQI